MKVQFTDEAIRMALAGLIASHITARNLPTLNAYQTAQDVVAKWKDVRCRLVFARLQSERAWLTHAEAAKLAGCSEGVAKDNWNRLKGVKIRLATGAVVPLFRKGVELLFRQRGTLDEVTFGGAACLRLQCHSTKGTAEDDRRIRVSTEESTDTYVRNYDGATDRLRAEGGTSEEELATARERTKVITGANGRQLALAGTGTDAE